MVCYQFYLSIRFILVDQNSTLGRGGGLILSVLSQIFTSHQYKLFEKGYIIDKYSPYEKRYCGTIGE